MSAWPAVSSGVHARHLYLHVPFCARRCVYCDFSIAVRATVPVTGFVDAMEREWRLRHGGESWHLETVYFGGGTPSKLGGEGIARLMEIVHRDATLDVDAEVTLEANPEDVSEANAREWRRAGINRVSLGVQSFDDRVLRWMHRTHDADIARRSIAILREAGLENISIDLIFAVPSELGRDWAADLDDALRHDLPHLSVYGLTVEPRTPLGRWVAREEVAESPEEAFELEFLQAHEALTAGGFEHYEVSNYGRPGLHSRHNWAYWLRKPYAGLGPSAHEFDGWRRRWNVAAFVEWLSQVEGGRDPCAGSESLNASEVVAEEVYLGLRTRMGLVLAGEERVHVNSWLQAGWAVCDADSRLRLTPAGWLRLDALASDLTLFRSRY